MALDKGLQDRGHTVTVCTCSRFDSFITGHGLQYGYMNDEVLALVDSDDVREVMGNIFPNFKLGGWYNRMTYSLTTRLTVLGVGGHPNRWRKAHGLRPQRRGTDFLRTQNGTPLPVIHPLSRHVLPVPTDWPDYIHATGYWLLDQPDDWQPAPELKALLAMGDPPVYVGFGSMIGLSPREITRTIVAALERAGVRGILATGWGGLAADALPDSILQIQVAPHSWLFPRMAVCSTPRRRRYHSGKPASRQTNGRLSLLWRPALLGRTSPCAGCGTRAATAEKTHGS